MREEGRGFRWMEKEEVSGRSWGWRNSTQNKWRNSIFNLKKNNAPWTEPVGIRNLLTRVRTRVQFLGLEWRRQRKRHVL